MKEKLFITGMVRSGTTLMDKILAVQPASCIFSQPLPYLFRELKRRYLGSLDAKDEYYVLNNYFNEDRYRWNELSAFLAKEQIAPDELDSILSAMEGYSGQGTAIHNIYDNDIRIKESFGEIVTRLLYSNCKDDVFSYVGLKEVLCEDFIPFMKTVGFKSILILRNPYDVLTSIHYGKGSKYTGVRRPSLFHLRNWRKSVAFASLFKDDADVLVVKYEDLLINPTEQLGLLSSFIGCEIDLAFMENATWKGNSSFTESGSKDILNKGSLNRYLEILPLSMIQYISYVCEAELKLLGYPLYHSSDYLLEMYQEPITIETEDFAQDYSSSAENIGLEHLRRNFLQKDCSETDKYRYFLDPAVYEVLRKALLNL